VTHAIVLVALFSLIVVGVVACDAPSKGPEPMRRVLLTGFDPFGKRTINDSWEAIRELDGVQVAGRTIVTARLPVVYDAMEAPLRAAIEKSRPEVVISFGEGTEVIRVETTGRNDYHPSKPLDNAKKPPPRDAIEPGGPATIPNALPTERILHAWAAASISSRASDDAGGYLCNECLYRLMRIDGTTVANVKRRGFIHVPVTGTKSPAGETFDLDMLRRAVWIAVEVTLGDIDEAAKAK
jgi:pyroglutamyl-peptidase